MAFLRQGADAAFVATLSGWRSISAKRFRQRPPQVRRIAHSGETEEPDRGPSCKERAKSDEGTEQRGRVPARPGTHGQVDAETAAEPSCLEV